jgi:hypothetical protein
VLKDVALENLENLEKPMTAAVDLGNILFNGQTSIQDSFGVLDADDTRTRVFSHNTVTFLNDLNNSIDVVSNVSSTFFHLSDGITGNAGFGSGQLLLELHNTSGFMADTIGLNLVSGNAVKLLFA